MGSNHLLGALRVPLTLPGSAGFDCRSRLTFSRIANSEGRCSSSAPQPILGFSLNILAQNTDRSLATRRLYLVVAEHTIQANMPDLVSQDLELELTGQPNSFYELTASERDSLRAPKTHEDPSNV